MKLDDLPDWHECAKAVYAETPTALQKFIYENEPHGMQHEHFRKELLELINEIKAEAKNT